MTFDGLIITEKIKRTRKINKKTVIFKLLTPGTNIFSVLKTLVVFIYSDTVLSRIDRLEIFFKRRVPHFLCFSDELLDVVFSLRQLLQLKIPEIF